MSRSTRPAAATAPARSARCASHPAGRSSRRSTCARSRPTSCRAAGGSPAVRRRRRTSSVEVPQLQTRPKAALAGVGRHVILRPAVQKRHLVLSEPTLEDQVSDLERVLNEMDDLELRVPLELVRALGKTLRDANWDVTAVVVDDLADRRRAGRHDGTAARDRLRPRHDDVRRDAARPRDGPAARPCARSSTRSSRSAPT